jgi:hypothetical protein
MLFIGRVQLGTFLILRIVFTGRLTTGSARRQAKQYE